MRCIVGTLQEYVKQPSQPEEWKRIADEFWNLWNFPMCCGAIDGKHLVMQCPPGAGSAFLNYKGNINQNVNSSRIYFRGGVIKENQVYSIRWEDYEKEKYIV